MKKLFLVIFGTLCVHAYAEIDFDGWYGKLFSGANFLQTERNSGVLNRYDTGYLISGSFGCQWDYFDLEAEYAYRRNALKSLNFLGRSYSMRGHFQSSSYMANLLWTLPLERCGCSLWGIQTFIGGGIGYDIQKNHGSEGGLSFKNNKNGFAWQIIAGFGYPVFCNTDLSLEYRFHKGPLGHLYNHSVGVGLTYSFR